MIDANDTTIIVPPTPAAWADMQTEINRLEREVERQTNIANNYSRLYDEVNQKIDNVKGYIYDEASMNGEISDDLKEVAGYLGITLTKEISGTATIEISWTATVPMDFDADDLEISYSIECESYDAEDFDYNEDNMDVRGEDA